MLRELIQNAADANASNVTIKLQTLPSRTVPVPQSSDPATLVRHTVENHTMRTLLVQNDGQVFGEADWVRLKRIAEVSQVPTRHSRADIKRFRRAIRTRQRLAHSGLDFTGTKRSSRC